MSEERVRGSIKWYNREKGYGFIRNPDGNGGPDIFLHAQELRRAGIEPNLRENQAISYVLSESPKGKGKCAVNVALVTD